MSRFLFALFSRVCLDHIYNCEFFSGHDSPVADEDTSLQGDHLDVLQLRALRPSEQRNPVGWKDPGLNLVSDQAYVQQEMLLSNQMAYFIQHQLLAQYLKELYLL